MKLGWNSKYTTIAVYALIVIFCVVFLTFLFVGNSGWGGLLQTLLSACLPVFYGILIAYLLAPSVRFFENKVLTGLDKKKRFHLKRILAISFTYLIVLVIAAVLGWRLLPAVFRGYADIQAKSGLYLQTVREWLLSLPAEGTTLSGYAEQVVSYFADLLEELYNSIGTVVPDVTALAVSVVDIGGNLFLGTVLSVYFLAAKENLLAQVKKFGHALLTERRYVKFGHALNLTERNFGCYVQGQISDALIMGVLCCLFSFLFGFPYYPLVSTLVGVACVLPMFGSLLGTVAGSLIILLADPIAVLWFMLMMVVLTEMNRRFIRPHVIRVGVEGSSAFMLSAIIIMTGILGFWGLLIGVPIATFLYALIQNRVNRQLAAKGLPTDRAAYYSTDAGKELYVENKQHKAKKQVAEKAIRESARIFTEELPAITDTDISAYELTKQKKIEDAADNAEKV